MVAALWLATTKGGAAQTWYHSDRLGSIRLMTNASGAERNEREFTGHITDAETQATSTLG
jgi:hypothetical protein